MYKLYSSLEVDTCKNRINESLFQHWKDRIFGLGYVGEIDIDDGYFWIYNRISMFRGKGGCYEFYAARKFRGNILKNNDETMIIGEFKLLIKYKIWWSIWFLTLSLMSSLCLYSFILSGNSFINILPVLIILFIMYIIGWGIVKYTIFRGKKAEEETIDFIKNLLEVYSVECEE